uniref:Rieske domain-containing protein n=1 Tax=Elaeophora elaphi TaxID=1147741 RepID=A0A0R3RT58_9BILA
MRTPSDTLKTSTQSLITQNEDEMVEDEDEMSDTKSKYLPPGADLPCECIFENGRIQLMSALCPEHGYLVRRRENSGLYFEIPGYIGRNEDDDMNDSGEDEMSEDKQDSESLSTSDEEKND